MCEASRSVIEAPSNLVTNRGEPVPNGSHRFPRTLGDRLASFTFHRQIEGSAPLLGKPGEGPFHAVDDLRGEWRRVGVGEIERNHSRGWNGPRRLCEV